MTTLQDHNYTQSNPNGSNNNANTQGPCSASPSRSHLNHLFTEKLGGPNYRVKWSDHYNNAWIFEGCDAIAIRDGTHNLFEHLIASKVSN